jgi:methionyl-tRNA synthetase
LPLTSQRLHSYLGYDGDLFGQQYTEEVVEQERAHLALRYDASNAHGRWAPSDLAPGQALRQPGPLFLKLEPEVAEAEMERMSSGA